MAKKHKCTKVCYDDGYEDGLAMGRAETENKILSIGKTYKFVVFSCGQTLTYTAEVIAVDNSFVTFKDKFGVNYTFNINSIISLQEKKWKP